MIHISNEEAWKKWADNNRDEYGSAAMRFAERWADLMEARMTEGAKLEDIAAECSREADTEGITAFMYGAAVCVLASSWEHGEALRRWHNLHEQLGNEGERANEKGTVLNPAMLSIG